MSILMRTLHIVHTLDILVAYKSTLPTRFSRVVPFVLKFALFVCANGIRSIFGTSFPPVPFDQQTMNDFIVIYVLVELVWESKSLDLICLILKGNISLLTQFQKSIRFLHTILFTIFRLIAGYKLVHSFSADYWQCVFVIVLFLEFNGIILKWMKGERSLLNLFTSMRESVTVALVVAIDSGLYLVLAYILITRHFMPVIRHFLDLRKKN